MKVMFCFRYKATYVYVCEIAIFSMRTDFDSDFFLFRSIYLLYSIFHIAQSDSTALLCAAMRGHTDCLRLLLEHGADTEAKSRVSFIVLCADVCSWMLKVIIVCSRELIFGHSISATCLLTLSRASSFISFIALSLESGFHNFTTLGSLVLRIQTNYL